MFRRFNNSKNRTTTLRFTWPLNLGNLLWWKLFLVMELRFFDEQMKMLMIMLMTMMLMLMLLMTMLLTMILMRYNYIRCSLSFHQFCSSSNFDRALINKT